MPGRASVIALVVAALVPLTACGRERLDVPDATQAPTAANPSERAYPALGLRFRAPESLVFIRGRLPLVASASSGSASVAVWRYPRAEPLPRTDAALEAAQQALVGAAEARDASFRLGAARRTKVDGAPAIELTGTQTVAGSERRVRSTHVYAKGTEVVVDQLAAPRDFDAVDRTVFVPLVGSLKIDPPRT